MKDETRIDPVLSGLDFPVPEIECQFSPAADHLGPVMYRFVYSCCGFTTLHCEQCRENVLMWDEWGVAPGWECDKCGATCQKIQDIIDIQPVTGGM